MIEDGRRGISHLDDLQQAHVIFYHREEFERFRQDDRRRRMGRFQKDDEREDDEREKDEIEEYDRWREMKIREDDRER